jgi:hypothetical protein
MKVNLMAYSISPVEMSEEEKSVREKEKVEKKNMR